MKMAPDVQEHMSTVTNNTVANKLLMIYILDSFKLVPIQFNIQHYWKIHFGALYLYVIRFGAFKLFMDETPHL